MSSLPFQSGATEFLLVQEDCIAGMQQLPAQSVDVVVTSPPYNIGARYHSYQDHRSIEDYLQWTGAWATAIHRVLKPQGSLFLNFGAIPRSPLLPHQIIITLSRLFALQNTFHWIKSISLPGPNGEMYSAGHYRPIHSQRFVHDAHEYVFHLTPLGTTMLDRLSVGVPYADKSNVKRWKGAERQDLRCRGNVWFIPYQTIRHRVTQRPHPATFPVQLAEQCIKLHGNVRETVMLDPFLGLGHAAIAARRCGVKRFIGFEIDAEYVAWARHQMGG
jgi:site-specific DNA-methyltransferase (adenine-specific)